MAHVKQIRTSDGRPALLAARMNGISRAALEKRIRLGWTVDDAATIPPHSWQKCYDAGQRARSARLSHTPAC